MQEEPKASQLFDIYTIKRYCKVENREIKSNQLGNINFVRKRSISKKLALICWVSLYTPLFLCLSFLNLPWNLFYLENDEKTKLLHLKKVEVHVYIKMNIISLN